jgi:hypothetical protein
MSRQLAAIEVVRARELDALLDAFDRARLPLLIIKGTALAYTIYDQPWKRTRCDTDVVVRKADVERARQLLRVAGYTEEPSAGGEVASTQRTFIRIDALAVKHVIDFHWALSNRPRLANALPFDELWERGESFRGHTHVRVPSYEDALLIAAVHMTGHHPGETKAVWLDDLELLAARADMQLVLRRAREKQLLHELLLTTGAQTRMSMLLGDLRETRGLGRKLRFLRETALPPAEHMQRKYGTTSRLTLPILYIRRAAGIFRP